MPLWATVLLIVLAVVVGLMLLGYLPSRRP